MHFFPLHINDYAQATSHLTLLEDAVYFRLLRKYYADEKPFPADIDRIQRLIGAKSKEEKEAVKAVLEEFFYFESECFRNKRADAEIDKFRSKSLKAKESANTRWMRTHSEGNAEPMRKVCDGNAIQEPLTSNHKPIKESKSASAPAAAKSVTKGTRIPFTDLPDEWAEFCRSERPELNPIKVWDSFHDYWVAIPGAKGVKTDWFATWRNWVRNQRQMTTDKQRKNDSWQSKLASLNTIDMEPSNGQVLSTDIVPF